MNHILIYSSNSFFPFCILRLKKTQVFFCFLFYSSVCLSSVFSIYAFLRKCLHELWSFSLKCARRLSQTQQTLPSETPPSCGISFLLLEDATLIRMALCVLLSERSIVDPKGKKRQKQLPPMEAKEDRLRDAFTSLGMLTRGTLIRYHSGTRCSRSREGSLALIPASLESMHGWPQGSFSEGDGFR